MFLLFLCLFSLDASARVLTWNDCTQIMAKNNPELLAARSNYESSEQVVKGTYGSFLPSLSASIGVSQNDPITLAGNPLYATSITASYNLFSGLRDRAKLKQAEANRKLSKANLDSTSAKISYGLRKAFAQLQYARENVALSELIRDRRFQNERIVRAQYESGRENEGSYLLSKSLYDQAVFEQRVAKDQLMIATQQLAHVLGEDGLDLEIRGEIPLNAPPESASIENLLFKTPTHRQSEAQVEVSESNSKVALSGFLPSLDLSGTLSQRDTRFLPEANRQWSLGLTLTIPIFNGLKTLRDYQSNQSLLSASRSTLTSTDFDLMTELRQTLVTFQQSIEKLKVDLDTLNAATIRAKIARKRYNNGLLAFEQWDIIETDLINRQKTALASKRDRILAESAYLQSQGLGDLP